MKKGESNKEDAVQRSPLISRRIPEDPYKSKPFDLSDELPTNVSSKDQLALLPQECLSGNEKRPLQHIGEDGSVSTYALQPMTFSVIFILLVEILERFSFYAINYTQTSYLTGAYNKDWNAGMESIAAASYVSISVAVAYTAPFLGAILGDAFIGEYWSVVVGAVGMYLPGLLLIALTTIPGLLGEEFNTKALSFGFLFLWPVGSGIVKSIVNIFGAKQFHPLLQSSLIEVYYVNFYMCINIGALVGGILVPSLAQQNVTLAYFLPVSMLTLGVCCFLMGTPRYVKDKPKGTLFKKGIKRSTRTKNISASQLFRVFLLIVPFCISYSQMPTTFIVQGTVMTKAFGFIDAALMYNNDTLSVLIFGYIVGSFLYPWLAKKGIKLSTTYKFAIGSGFGALAIGWALVVDYMIHKTYEETGGTVNILWQAFSYIFIGCGEIFAISAAYECAFTASPPEKKVLSSALNIFCIGGIPNIICIGLYQACRPWFMNDRGTAHISDIKDYASARVDKYFWVLFGISIFGVVLNLLPPVHRYVESVEETATDLLKTPKTPLRPIALQPDEEEAFLQAKRHQYYLKYGSDKKLYHAGSFRAGPNILSASEVKDTSKHIKRDMLSKLYKSDGGVPEFVNADGKPAFKSLKNKNSITGKKELEFERSPSEL